MKKIFITLLIVLTLFVTFSTVYATTIENSDDNQFVKIAQREKIWKRSNGKEEV